MVTSATTHVRQLASEWHELGRVVRLQIQRSSLKVGPPGGRYYDPAPLLALEALYATIDGVASDRDGLRLDVHNARHEQSKNVQGINGISIGFTTHYERMRGVYGSHVVDGIAGENVLIATDRVITLSDIAGGLRIEGEDGRSIALTGVRVAHPCVEFSRFVLGDPVAPAAALTSVLQFLDGGTRGFYAVVEVSRPTIITLGDRVYGKGGLE